MNISKLALSFKQRPKFQNDMPCGDVPPASDSHIIPWNGDQAMIAALAGPVGVI